MFVALRTEAAERDLLQIAFQIAVTDGRPTTAKRIIDELVAQSQKIADLSRVAILGVTADELGERIRLFQFKRWVLIFRYTDQGINVMRIADASQDFQAWKLS